MNRSKKKLLVVSWALPPILTARAIQVGRILRELAVQGWEIEVLSVDANSLGRLVPQDPFLESIYVQGYKVHRLASPFMRNWSVLAQRFLPSLKSLPDNETGWAQRAKEVGKELFRISNFDCILSFGQPWSSHLVAMEFHAVSGIPWVAHFSDPWADNPYYASLASSQMERMKLLEARVISEATGAIFTNQQTLNVVMAKYQTQLRKKASILPHTFDDYQPEEALHFTERSNKLRIVHTGALYGLRNPERLIRGLGELNKSLPVSQDMLVQFEGFVKHQKRYQRLIEAYGLSGSIEFSGQQDYRHANRMAASADVLLLIDAPADVSLFLPSKLIEYFKFKIPILGITPKNGASADLLRKLECPVAPPDDIEAIKQEITTLWRRWKNGGLNISANFDEVVKPYHVSHVTRQLVSLLSSVIA